MGSELPSKDFFWSPYSGAAVVVDSSLNLVNLSLLIGEVF